MFIASARCCEASGVLKNHLAILSIALSFKILNVFFQERIIIVRIQGKFKGLFIEGLLIVRIISINSASKCSGSYRLRLPRLVEPLFELVDVAGQDVGFLFIYIYIYIHRERERDHVHVCI